MWHRRDQRNRQPPQPGFGHQPSPSPASLYSITNKNGGATGSGYRAPNQQQLTFNIGLHNLEVQSGGLTITHPAWHFLAPKDPRRGSALADRTRLSMHLMRTMRSPLTGETMALHGARKALTSTD
jgi:hypothetical protein